MEFPFEKLEEQFKKVPEDVQIAISSEDTADRVEKIGTQHNLHIDEIGALFNITGAVMLGIIRPNDYIKTLREELGLDEKQAREVAEDVNKEVFRPIRESLKGIHSVSETTDTETRINPLLRLAEKDDESRGVKKLIPARSSAPGVELGDGGEAEGSEVPQGLPVETEGQPAPEFEDEYPHDDGGEKIESKEEILREIEGRPEDKEAKKQKNKKTNGHEDKEEREPKHEAEVETEKQNPAGIVGQRLGGMVRTQSEKSEHGDIDRQADQHGEYIGGGGNDPYREPLT